MRAAAKRAKAFDAKGDDSLPLFPLSPSRAVKFSCARNGAQETRPRSPASPRKSRNCKKRSQTLEAVGQDRGDPPCRLDRTGEAKGEGQIHLAGSIRDRGMRAPGDIDPRKPMTAQIIPTLRSEGSLATVRVIHQAGLINHGQGMHAIHQAGPTNRDQGMQVADGLSPRTPMTETISLALRSEDDSLTVGTPENASARPAGLMNRARGTPSGIDLRNAKPEGGKVPPGGREVPLRTRIDFPAPIRAGKLRIPDHAMKGENSTGARTTQATAIVAMQGNCGSPKGATSAGNLPNGRKGGI